MTLKNKVAVIYGAGGAVGGAVARAFAREGPGFFSPSASWPRSKLSPVKSLPPEDPPRLRRSALSMNEPWTAIYNP
jgi:hypothetical protein